MYIFPQMGNGRNDSNLVTIRKKTSIFNISLNPKRGLSLWIAGTSERTSHPATVPQQKQRLRRLSGKELMINPYIFLFGCYVFPKSIFRTTPRILQRPIPISVRFVYLSMLLIYSRSSCCFAKMSKAMEGTYLKLRNSLLLECCICRNTVDL